MTLTPWLRFFRLPNLPTAPGDALAGAVVLMAFDGGNLTRALVAGAAALGFYLFGLADNDLVGEAADRVSAPERPLPSGEISRTAAKAARSVSLFLALLAGTLAGLPPAWWLIATLLTLTICLYNRLKNKWLMGLCRGLSVLSGGAAVLRAKLPMGTTFAEVPGFTTGLLVLIGIAVGWTLYIAAVTKLSEGEEQSSDGLGFARWFWGCAAFVPVLSLMAIPMLLPESISEPLNPRILLLPLLGSCWTFANWCVAVFPLSEPHDSGERRQAVGRTIGALLYLQLGFILMIRSQALLVVVVLLWLSARLIRRWAPSISGS